VINTNLNPDRKLPQSAKTQILLLLLRAQGAEVSSVALGRITPQYCGLIEDLRLLGFPITERTEQRDEKVYFQLDARRVSEELPKAITAATSSSASRRFHRERGNVPVST